MGRLAVYIANLGKYLEGCGCRYGQWLQLPCSADKLHEVLEAIGINDQYEEYFITDSESRIPNITINQYASLSELNELAAKIEELADFDYEKLAAVLEWESSLTVAGMIEIIDNLDSYTVYGESQELKVFENRCVLETYGNFDDEEMEKRYAKLIRKGSHSGLISNNVARAVVHGVMGGGIVKAGMSLAKSAIMDAAVGTIAPDRASFKVRKGKVTLDYAIYDVVEFQKVLSIGFEDELGYMRFRCSQQAGKEVIFFFTNNYAAEEMYSYICNRIDAVKKKQLEKSTRQTKEHISAADELLKFKQLLDMGAITQEEYDAKKKQLLGL